MRHKLVLIMAMTQAEMIEQLEQAYQRIDDALEALNEAQILTDDVRNALTDEHPAIHQDLVEVQWYKTAEVQPKENQRVIVQDAHGAQYFMTYPFSATKYPLWWVIPQASK